MCDTMRVFPTGLAGMPARLNQSRSTGKQDLGQKCIHLHRLSRRILPKGCFDPHFRSAIWVENNQTS